MCDAPMMKGGRLLEGSLEPGYLNILGEDTRSQLPTQKILYTSRMQGGRNRSERMWVHQPREYLIFMDIGDKNKWNEENEAKQRYL